MDDRACSADSEMVSTSSGYLSVCHSGLLKLNFNFIPERIEEWNYVSDYMAWARLGMRFFRAKTPDFGCGLGPFDVFCLNLSALAV